MATSNAENAMEGTSLPDRIADGGSSKKRIYSSEDLFKEDREILILHGQAQYRLQITKAGKLILNK